MESNELELTFVETSISVKTFIYNLKVGIYILSTDKIKFIISWNQHFRNCYYLDQLEPLHFELGKLRKLHFWNE